MAGQPNLNDGLFKDVLRRVRKLEAASPMNNSAVGRSGFEVYDGGAINISNGSFYLNGYGSVAGTLAVSGSLPVTGGLVVSGTERITGSWFLDGLGEVAGTMTVTGGLIVKGEQRVSGTLEITGKLTVTGPTKLDGTTDITGKSTLQNDLEVKAGGKVRVGRMRIDPSVGNGSIVFENGGQIYTDGATIQMYKGTSAVQVEDGAAKLMGNGGSYVTADSAGVRVAGGLRVMSPQAAPVGAKANVYMDAAGNIFRVSS